MSSLIFVVILAVWAVYLVQHWVRRRDHVATARSVDRYSEAMRVLERRRALPRPDVSDQAPPSYSVSPLRPARPEVVVKRGMPQLVASAREAGALGGVEGAATARRAVDAPAARRTSGAPEARRTVDAPAARRTSGATAVAPPPAFRRAKRAAQLRAAALLLASVAMVTLVTLGVGQILDLWWSFVGVGVLAATLVLVRRSASAAARAAARRRRAGRTQHVRPAPAGVSAAETSRATQPPAPTSEEPVRTTHEAADSPLAAQARATAAAAHTSVAPARTARREVDLTAAARPALYDIDAVEASLVAATTSVETMTDDAAAVGAEQAAMAVPGSWSPTPVPPPTYTLKAKAYRGAPSGSTELPADGTEMALEEEFEELPRIDRVV